MARTKLKPEHIRRRDEQKGQFYRAPGDRVSYFDMGAIKRFIPREGTNKIRIVEPIEALELEFFGLDMHFHRDVGEKGEDLYGDYICNERMKAFVKKMYPEKEMSGKCYVCEQQTSDLWDENPGLAKTYYPDRRMWFFVLDLLSDNPTELLLWSCPWTLYEEVVSRSTNAETGQHVVVSCPETGVPISFERIGKDRFTKYKNVQIFSKPMPIGKAILDQLIPFDEILIIPDYEKVKLAFHGETYGTATADRGHVTRRLDVDPNEDKSNEDLPAEDSPPDCYQKEYDKWKDCETCEFADPCANPPKEDKPSREEKPQRIERPNRPSRTSSDVPDDDELEKEKNDIRNRIMNAQANRKTANA